MISLRKINKYRLFSSSLCNESFLEKLEINAEEKGRKASARHVPQLYNLQHRFYNFEREIRRVPDWQSNVLQIVVLIDLKAWNAWSGPICNRE